MISAVIGMVAFILPVVCVTLGIVVKMRETIQKMSKQLSTIETILKENKK
jgi:hypothetical protein